MRNMKKIMALTLVLALLAGMTVTGAADGPLTGDQAASVIWLYPGEINGLPGEEYELRHEIRDWERLSEALVWTSGNPSVARVSPEGVVTLVSPGTTVVAVSTASGLYDTCRVTVREIYELTVGKTQTIAVDEWLQQCEFTPEENGWYGFSNSGCPGRDYYAALYDSQGVLLEETWEDEETGNFQLCHELVAGQHYKLQIRCGHYDQGGAYQLQVNPVAEPVKPDPNEMILSRNTLEDAMGGIVGISAFLRSGADIEEKITWTSSDTSVVVIEDWYDNWCQLYFAGVGTATVTATTESGLSASCEVTVKGYPRLTCGDSVTVDPTQGDSMHCFIPEEDGWYGFYTTGGSSDPAAILRNGNLMEITREDNGGDDGHFVLSYELTAGEIYYIETYCWGFAAEEPYQLHLDKAVPATSMTLSYESVTGHPNTTDYELVAKLSPLPSIPQKITWSSSDETVAALSRANYVWFKALGTAVITATSENGLSAQCQVTVEDYPAMEPGVPVFVEGNGEEQTFVFVPETDGYYCFFSTGATTSIEGSMAHDKWELTSDHGLPDFWVRFSLSAGRRYYLSSEPFFDGTDCSYTLHLMPMTQATGIGLKRARLSGYQGEEYYLDPHMEPVNAYEEKITWTSSDENVAIVMGDTVFFRFPGSCVVTGVSESGITTTLPVTVRRIPEISNGETFRADARDWETRLRFVPREDGVYEFASQGLEGGEVAVYDSGNVLQEASCPEGDFRISCRMQAGLVYYLSCRPQNEEGAYQLMLAKQEGVTLSGTVRSAGTDPVTVELLTARGEPVGTLTTVDGSYCFENVAPGSYTLRVSVPHHVSREYAVSLDTQAVVLETAACPLGDATGDGAVNVADTSKIYASIRGIAQITDEYRLACADVNGGGLNISDVSALYAHVRGTKLLY